MGRVGNGLLYVERGDLDSIGVHDGPSILFFASLSDTEIIVATKRIHIELVKTDGLVRGGFQDHGGSGVTNGQASKTRIHISFNLFLRCPCQVSDIFSAHYHASPN